jgi:hypothetical protein
MLGLNNVVVVVVVLLLLLIIKKKPFELLFAKGCCQIWANSFYGNHPGRIECFDVLRIFLENSF